MMPWGTMFLELRPCNTRYYEEIMLLAIDIGNTNITIGIFKFENGRPVQRPSKIWRLSTNKAKTSDEYGTKILDLFNYSLLEISAVRGVVIASVVPALNAAFEEMSRTYFRKKPYVINSETPGLIDILYDNPKEVGADRIADAVGAYTLFGGPVIIIDFGTATTFDCVSKKGEYLGGAIAPGPLISAESLAERTAKLPRVDMARPKEAIGKSTIKSIQSGLYFGYVGLIKEILKRIRKELPGNPQIIATGGLASLIVPEIKEVRKIVPELTLEGMRIIWEKITAEKMEKSAGNI
jgi:type III pantothenate kinase